MFTKLLARSIKSAGMGSRRLVNSALLVCLIEETLAGRGKELHQKTTAAEGARDDVRVRAERGYLLTFDRVEHPSTEAGCACWLVLPFRATADLAEAAEQCVEEVVAGLAESRKVHLVSPTTALSYRGREGDVRQFAAECHADHVVEGGLRREEQSIRIGVWLVDGESGHTRRFKRFKSTSPSDSARQAVAWLLQDAAE